LWRLVVGYERRVVVDLDDTISYTLNRNWDNAEPIQPTIDKINQLYDMGWEVYIVTARGQLSCNGDSMAADKKYRTQIEAWLKKHNIRYTMLSFNKFLAAYYVDDKMLSPEAFARLDIEVLRQGQSGAVVERRGDRVFKTGDRVKDEAAWYLTAQSIMPEYLPEIYSFVGSTLCLEYVHNVQPRLIDSGHICAIRDFLNRMSRYTSPSTSSISTMLERIKKHIDSWTVYGFIQQDGDLLYDAVESMVSSISDWDSLRTFSHGDLSLDNVLWTNNGIKVIDPIFDPNCYSSIVFDAGKMLHSLRRQNRMQTFAEALPIMSDFVSSRFTLGKLISTKILHIAEIIQWIRIIKYISDPIERDEALNTILDLKRKILEGAIS
jgi:capsule biosynthesis phosphatase